MPGTKENPSNRGRLPAALFNRKEPTLSYLSIDFETGSQADLKKVGAAKYAEDPTTRVVCVADTTPWNLSDTKAIRRDYIGPGFN